MKQRSPPTAGRPGQPVSTSARGDTPAASGVRLHDLRHTFATMALDDGHDYREASEKLGHADYATTLRVYAHWIPDTRENNMSAPPTRSPPPTTSCPCGPARPPKSPGAPTRAPARREGGYRGSSAPTSVPQKGGSSSPGCKPSTLRIGTPPINMRRTGPLSSKSIVTVRRGPLPSCLTTVPKPYSS